MNSIYLFTFTALSFLLLLASACSSEKSESGLHLGDTITTASGLKYYYTRIGNGPQVQTGSKVYTYLALSVEGKEVWNTNEQPDSAFVFVANKDRMIKGFTEVTMVLREGDEIVCILPPDLAYGEKGSGNVIPPYATLVYTKYRMLKVNEPKASLSDTLLLAYKTGGHENMVARYQQVMNSSDTAMYYFDQGQWRMLWNLLNDEGMHKEALEMITYSNTKNESGLRYNRIRSYDQLGMYKLALDSLTALVASDTSYANSERVLKLRGELEEKLWKAK